MAEDRSGLMKVAFEDIEVGVVDNNRIDFGDLAGLADSIVKDGLLQPLVVLHKHYGGNGCVRPDGKKVFSRYILVSVMVLFPAREWLPLLREYVFEDDWT
jgi:hypothetical protein